VSLNGGNEIAAIIRDVDDNEAAMIVTETNLRHREKLFPSEKAFASKLQLEAIKRQGKRSDLEGDPTSARIAQKFSRDIIAEINEVSKDEIQRYIRRTFLIPPLLDLVDTEKIPLYAGVNLSYLDEPAQTLAHRYFFEEDSGVKLDLKAATALSTAFKESGDLTQEMIETLFYENQKPIPSKTFSISRKKLLPYLDRLPDNNELERLFMEFLESRFGEKDVTDVEKVS
jgi:ParB family chromosome partitioning protein